jgi:hypothetical protein
MSGLDAVAKKVSAPTDNRTPVVQPELQKHHFRISNSCRISSYPVTEVICASVESGCMREVPVSNLSSDTVSLDRDFKMILSPSGRMPW